MLNKSVVVTGGSRGIGLGITRAFVEAGYFVVVGARTESDGKHLGGERVRFVQSDVQDEDAHSRLVDVAVAETGTLDAYVNNAGFSEWRPIGNIDGKFLDDVLGVNLKGPFWGCKAASAAMSEGGSIINISSIAGKRGSSNNSAYCASKFGMNGLTQALATELGPRGIRVNALCPVLITTDGLVDALRSPSAPAGGEPEAFISRFAAANAPLKRLPTSEEVAAMCVFLSSEAASAMTGQCINVDCGVFPQ